MTLKDLMKEAKELGDCFPTYDIPLDQDVHFELDRKQGQHIIKVIIEKERIMTKEECIALLYRYAEYNGMGIPNLAGCKEAMKMAADLLSQPSLPSNLDEAAEKYSDDHSFHFCDYDVTPYDAFKAGAEWMAGQFQKIEGELVDWYSTSDGKDYCCGVKTIDAFEVPEGFYIRKKY